MNYANTLIRFAPRLAALALLGGIPFANAAALGDGKLTIGVALPQVQLGQGADAAEPLRQSVMNRLRSPNVEVVALSGNTPAEIEADAKGKGCSQVLYTNVERKHGIGGLLGKLAPLAGVLPGIASGGGGGGGGSGLTGLLTQGAASMASNAAAASAQKQMMGAQQQMLAGAQAELGQAQAQALQMAARASIKRGDNIAFDYRLAAADGGAPLKSALLRAKADADGQDVLSPLVEQLAQSMGLSAQAAGGGPQTTDGTMGSGATGSATPPDTSRAGNTSRWHGLFGARDRSASTSSTTAAPANGGMPDCAQIASMPNTPISFEACQKMASAQQAYDRAASDPSAARPGDEQMSCEQIKSEMRLQQYSAPDKATVAATTAAVTKEQALLNKHIAEANAVMAQEQVKVDAAVAADQATGLATAGLVNPNAASAAAMAAQARVKAVGERQAAERRPTEQKMIGGVADLGVDAAQQLSSNPRLARLLQLAQSRGCKGS
jgi:hypothetical protein